MIIRPMPTVINYAETINVNPNTLYAWRNDRIYWKDFVVNREWQNTSYSYTSFILLIQGIERDGILIEQKALSDAQIGKILSE